MTFDPHAHHHANDPDTSRAAAVAAEGLSARHKAIIGAVLIFAHPAGLTSQEIAERCGLNYWQVARRLSELRRDGVVVETTERRKTRSGRTACVWRTARGQMEMFEDIPA